MLLSGGAGLPENDADSEHHHTDGVRKPQIRWLEPPASSIPRFRFNESPPWRAMNLIQSHEGRATGLVGTGRLCGHESFLHSIIRVPVHPTGPNVCGKDPKVRAGPQLPGGWPYCLGTSVASLNPRSSGLRGTSNTPDKPSVNAKGRKYIIRQLLTSIHLPQGSR
ncbi:hypothetical protein NDU88_010847 [Pleurodeles waltl]|uniref:Uncharacterized protein n=1 Tax=Pleurodeles waltl TaxID=8319 RepID=A0AAV7S1Z4_PLEWA|nr:hypothetical protein NDU88_010847 [Pleurodeles waltl]